MRAEPTLVDSMPRIDALRPRYLRELEGSGELGSARDRLHDISTYRDDVTPVTITTSYRMSPQDQRRVDLTLGTVFGCCRFWSRPFVVLL